MEYDYLYEDNVENRPQRVIRLQRGGIVEIRLRENEFNSNGIVTLLNDLNYVIKTYRRGCKKIILRCKKFCPADKLTYILLESIIYDLKVNKNYEVQLCVGQLLQSISTEGIAYSTINYFPNLKEYQRKYVFDQTMNHFRRLFTSQQSQGSGVSSLLGELKVFFVTSGLQKDKTDQLAQTISELVDNVGEHTQSDCLIDIDITTSNYKKRGEPFGFYYAVNTVVLNLDEKKLGDNVREKFENHYFGSSARYQTVEDAYTNHKKLFDDKYNEEDFFNLVTFQDEITGRKYEVEMGGTGLTELIKSLEANAEEHGCYVLSGKQGLFFKPDLLEYNDEKWLGFNIEREFVNSRPDESAIFRSNAYIRGTAYNFTLVYREAE